MALSFVDLTPSQALDRARKKDVRGSEEVWPALDRHFRWHLLRYLQDRAGDPTELREALLGAVHRARQEEREPWSRNWPYLLELLRDAERTPALATEIRDLGGAGGRAREMLAVLAENGKPMRPTDLGARLELGKQQVSNLGKKLEQAGLILRQKGSGRASWYLPTTRGLRLAALLPGGQENEEAMAEPRVAGTSGEPAASKVLLWRPKEINSEVELPEDESEAATAVG